MSDQFMKTAVIGLGEMGRMLTELMIGAGVIRIDDIRIYNRTPARWETLKTEHPGLYCTTDAHLAVQDADVVFLCVKPAACAQILQSIVPVMNPAALLVSIAADVPLSCLSSVWSGPVVRIMPTLTSWAGYGFTLRTADSPAGHVSNGTLDTLFSDKLRFMDVPESSFNALSALSSCGPGLISAVIRMLYESAGRSCGLDNRLLEILAIESTRGVLALSEKQSMSLSELTSRVATSGGVTEAGLSVLARCLPGIFDEMNKNMENRHHDRSESVNNAFLALQKTAVKG